MIQRNLYLGQLNILIRRPPDSDGVPGILVVVMLEAAGQMLLDCTYQIAHGITSR